MNLARIRRKYGVRLRKGPVEMADRRCPMLRLLQDGQTRPDERGMMVVVSYDQQWRTLWRAQRLGYLDADQYLTDEGREYLAKAGT